jgi:catechol 2,3-dioxygenase-like lactoylglutathione lyase family enzyme
MRFALLSFVMVVGCFVMYPVSGSRSDDASNNTSGKSNLQLGNFSISLTVKDVNASKEFYEKLGFKVSGGDLKRKYVILQNDTSTIGLYQGMFEKNSLTYNPGWDRDCKTLPEFQDVREIQQELKKRGLNPVVAADESTSGPAFLTLVDPDGNPVLIDQHVSKPAKK